MTNFNGVPKFDTDGGKTLEKSNEGEKSNLLKAEQVQFERFSIAINTLLDSWVKEGKCPQRWADMKRESVQTITNANLHPDTIAERERGEGAASFFSEMTPEAYATQFAEIGLESIMEFRKQVDSARDATLATIIPVVERADAMLMEQNREDDSLAQKEKLEKIKNLILTIKEKVRIFNEKFEEIKELRFTLEDQALDSLKNEISDLKMALGKEKKEFDPTLN